MLGHLQVQRWRRADPVDTHVAGRAHEWLSPPGTVWFMTYCRFECRADTQQSVIVSFTDQVVRGISISEQNEVNRIPVWVILSWKWWMRTIGIYTTRFYNLSNISGHGRSVSANVTGEFSHKVTRKMFPFDDVIMLHVFIVNKRTFDMHIGLCEENSPVTGEFPARMASNAENVYIWWCHHGDLESTAN